MSRSLFPWGFEKVGPTGLHSENSALRASIRKSRPYTGLHSEKSALWAFTRNSRPYGPPFKKNRPHGPPFGKVGPPGLHLENAAIWPSIQKNSAPMGLYSEKSALRASIRKSRPYGPPHGTVGPTGLHLENAAI